MNRVAKVFPCLVGACLIAVPALAAEADWQEYIYEDLGVAKEFPLEPVRSTGVYAAPETSRDEARIAGPGRPTVLLQTELDHVVYRMEVVDISDDLANSANIFSECAYLVEQAGITESNVHLGVGGGSGEIYGRLATVDLYQEKGRLLSACFFNTGNLYRIEAHILPEHGDLGSPDAFRFVSTVRFDWSEDGEESEAEALAAYQYFLEHGVYPDEEEDN